MSDVTTADILAVQQLVAEYAFRNDHGQADRLHELVTEDYRSTGPMGEMVGREALAAWGAKRVQVPAQVRHVLSNVRVFRDEAGALASTSYYVAFRDSGANPASPASMGEYHDTYAEVDGVLHLASRTVVPAFADPGAPRPNVAGGKP